LFSKSDIWITTYHFLEEHCTELSLYIAAFKEVTKSREFGEFIFFSEISLFFINT